MLTKPGHRQLESYFMKFCGKVVISPNTGVGPDDEDEDPEDDEHWNPPDE